MNHKPLITYAQPYRDMWFAYQVLRCMGFSPEELTVVCAAKCHHRDTGELSKNTFGMQVNSHGKSFLMTLDCMGDDISPTQVLNTWVEFATAANKAAVQDLRDVAESSRLLHLDPCFSWQLYQALTLNGISVKFELENAPDIVRG